MLEVTEKDLRDNTIVLEYKFNVVLKNGEQHEVNWKYGIDKERIIENIFKNDELMYWYLESLDMYENKIEDLLDNKKELKEYIINNIDDIVNYAEGNLVIDYEEDAIKNCEESFGETLADIWRK